MGASITLAGESLIAQKQGAKQPLIVRHVVLANVPGLDANAPIDRAAGKPAAGQIVGTFDVTQQGYVNPNQVVYSLMMGSDIGDFDWNWIGLETAEGVLLTVAYVPLQQKRRNIPPMQLGNNVTRNFMVVFDGAQALTGITIDASTWQHDFTVRLKGIDERERLSNRDVFGRACFFSDGLKVEQIGQKFQVKSGIAYIEGARVMLAEPFAITPPNLPATAWLDVALQRQLNDVVVSWAVKFAADLPDYVDSVGVRHYCIPLANLTASAITDRRVSESVNGPLIQHFASRTGDYPQLRARATTKQDVGLGNLPNAITDSADADDSWVLASTKAMANVRRILQQAINNVLNGTTPAGNAKQLETARRISITGAGSGYTSFDGSQDVSLNLILPDSGVKAGTYPKVTVNAKGLITAGSSLNASDIPGLDWSKIQSGRPTTLEGYGISNAIPTGLTNKRPRLFAPELGPVGGAMEIREARCIDSASTDFAYAPRLFFHWSNVIYGDLAMASSGDLCWTTHKIWHAGNFDPGTAVQRGAIVAFCFSKTPDGYLKANGAAVSRTVYRKLFDLLGTFYGPGDGATTFNLPDLRGRFIRGFDEGLGLDPGRVFGSVQSSQNLAHGHAARSDAQGEHIHGLIKSAGSNNTPGGFVSPANAGNAVVNTEPAGRHSHTITVDPSGGNESRPVNIALNYCIKY